MQVVYNLTGVSTKLGADGHTPLTLPLSVVAANSLAAASTELDSSMASVAVQASSCVSSQPHVPGRRRTPTYRLLELLQKLMCLLLLCAIRRGRHSVVRRQHRVEDLLSVGSHAEGI